MQKSGPISWLGLVCQLYHQLALLNAARSPQWKFCGQRYLEKDLDESKVKVDVLWEKYLEKDLDDSKVKVKVKVDVLWEKYLEKDLDESKVKVKVKVDVLWAKIS